MPRLLLIKHAHPAIVPEVDAKRWRLSEQGRESCARLAALVAPEQPTALFASAEPKARETAMLLGERLGLTALVATGLHEHDRSGESFVDQATFEAQVARFFAEPRALVHGRETAEAARLRFRAAVDDILGRHPGETVAIVAHGTVISLYVAERAGVEPFAFWKRLGLPSFVILEREHGTVLRVVDRIE